MVGRKIFLANPKHQYDLSKCGERYCNVQSQKEWRLLYESWFDYKANGGKKSFSCKSKASISCIPTTRT